MQSRPYLEQNEREQSRGDVVHHDAPSVAQSLELAFLLAEMLNLEAGERHKRAA